jgi:hypothetical protein
MLFKIIPATGNDNCNRCVRIIPIGEFCLQIKAGSDRLSTGYLCIPCLEVLAEKAKGSE